MFPGEIINKTVIIQASVSDVWKTLTDPELIKLWMLDSETEIITNWKIGSPIIIKGNLHWINFENKGTVLQFEKEKILQYNYLSSLSELPDVPENYLVLTFALASSKDQTILTLTLSNFVTETIYKHSEFYWRTTLEIIKKVIEK